MKKYPIVSKTGREYKVIIDESDYWAHPDLRIRLFIVKKGIFGINRRVLVSEREFSNASFSEEFKCDYVNLVRHCVKRYEHGEYYPWVRFEDWNGKC